MQENQEVGPMIERSDEKQTKKSPEDTRTYKYKPQKKKGYKKKITTTSSSEEAIQGLMNKRSKAASFRIFGEIEEPVKFIRIGMLG